MGSDGTSDALHGATVATMKKLLLILLASPVWAGGPKYSHKDAHLNDEIQNLYHDIRNSQYALQGSSYAVGAISVSSLTATQATISSATIQNGTINSPIFGNATITTSSFTATGNASFTSASSTVTFAGWIDMGFITQANTGAGGIARAGCGDGRRALSGGCICNSTNVLVESIMTTECTDATSVGTPVSDGASTGCSWTCASNTAVSLTAYVHCGRVK